MSNIQNLLKLNSYGVVKNEGDLSKLQKKFRKIIDKVIIHTQKIFSGRILSTYVRGSVSIGKAIEGVSDIDIVVVLKEPVPKKSLEWIAKYSGEIEKTYKSITTLDLTIVSLDELLYSQEYKNLRIYIKTQSCLLTGKDILPLLSPVIPGRHLAIYMYGHVIDELKELYRIFKNGKTKRTYLFRKRPIDFWCIWMCRTILRSGMAATMSTKPLYTPELRACCAVFSEQYPELSKEMKQILTWARYPIGDTKKLCKFLDVFIPKYAMIWYQINKNG